MNSRLSQGYDFAEIKHDLLKREFRPFILGLATLAAHKPIRSFVLKNTLLQAAIFIPIACLPALYTRKMSFVDIAWPFGLVAIGTQGLLRGNLKSPKNIVVSSIYLIMGLRMGLGAIYMEASGEWAGELARYKYQRLRWEAKGLKNESFNMIFEILMQAAGNSTILAVPAMLAALNNSKKLNTIDLLALITWAGSWFMESQADVHKMKFSADCRKEGIGKKSCDVGLWRYSRHPNYFFQWMQWNALIALTLSDLKTFSQNNWFRTATVGSSLFGASACMYYVLNYYSGAEPAEYYSLQSRSDYKDYQTRTSKFFPNFPKG